VGRDRGLLGLKPEPGAALLVGRDAVVGDETAGLFGHAGVLSDQEFRLSKARVPDRGVRLLQQVVPAPSAPPSFGRNGPYRAC
jgi:hypothetical protein